jgi:hypothetical protein
MLPLILTLVPLALGISVVVFTGLGAHRWHGQKKLESAVGLAGHTRMVRPD